MSKKTGIYKITNILTGDLYIGSATDIVKRWWLHKYQLLKNIHHSTYLQNAYNKYGKNTFIFEVLLYCEIKDLLFFEQRAIDTYNPVYNMCKIAGSNRGLTISDEHKQKIAKANLKNTHRLGKVLSKEHIQKISEANSGENNYMFGKKHSKEMRQKMSNNSKDKSGENNPMFGVHRFGNLNPMFGKHQSEETKKKISEAAKNRKKDTNNV